MIRTFRCADTEVLFRDGSVPRFQAIDRPARRKLMVLNQARRLEDLMIPAGPGAEGMAGADGWYCLPVEGEWGIFFRWVDNNAEDVELRDEVKRSGTWQKTLLNRLRRAKSS